MSASDIRSESRGRFVKFLSGSPLLAYSGLDTLAADGPTAPPRLSDPILWAPLRTEDLIKSPAEAINVFDFEPVARKTVPPAHFGYMASGIDDEVTLRAKSRWLPGAGRDRGPRGGPQPRNSVQAAPRGHQELPGLPPARNRGAGAAQAQLRRH